MYSGNLSAIKLNFENPPLLEQRKKRLTSGTIASKLKIEGEHNGVMNPSDSDSEDEFATSVQSLGSNQNRFRKHTLLHA